eukprot:CAMPEP_0184715472 /NCGR_PEP_ID=MMETSP0314-20130426/5393_1 /TAXON_ID=38298 /ORGANISM="Rhodella maculata, Strain CCMP 736" /LENGTH=60 /DNA_ID=CAMNT_0027178623 /DNA_START=14 /DNA_END=193 /DNA_ORIENTATION=+
MTKTSSSALTAQSMASWYASPQEFPILRLPLLPLPPRLTPPFPPQAFDKAVSNFDPSTDR